MFGPSRQIVPRTISPLHASLPCSAIERLSLIGPLLHVVRTCHAARSYHYSSIIEHVSKRGEVLETLSILLKAFAFTGLVHCEQTAVGHLVSRLSRKLHKVGDKDSSDEEGQVQRRRVVVSMGRTQVKVCRVPRPGIRSERLMTKSTVEGGAL
jgi:hypothetical protein